MKIEDNGNTVIITFSPHECDNEAPLTVHLRVLLEALMVYEKRNKKYKDNWKRMGWRGQLIRIRERAERLWDDFWNKPTSPGDQEAWDADDALDLINFAAFFVRAVRAGERDGTWWEEK